MGFMNSYKRLDNLCRDMNGIGVTVYIEDMKPGLNNNCYIDGWKDDYYHLKKYRHIRNKIAHENNVYEEDVCSDEDVAWLENFYQRIIKQTDPLALYYKANQSFKAGEMEKPSNSQRIQPNFTYNNSDRKLNDKKNAGGDDGIVSLIFIAMVIGIVYILYFR